MSDHARIAEILRSAGILLPNDYTRSWDYNRALNELAAQIDAAVRPRIETLEQLDALPPETIVKTEGGTVACRFYDREHGVVFGDDRPFKWSALATELPAIVLWSPEVDR
ncbi:hypothetical protein [Mycolicibacterium mageritense]|uniref:hypothetical protein n=1 Tax=Mycolicibacterium mageritense TaxID=53462 RepID=UPI001E4D7181|nr:hypothetical protein [Mycolicibacterium mageritense]GJJ22311.1 hypothetical protein MTY414_59840 [Mycolicibacterium mageritense]